MKAKLIKLEDGYELFTQGFLKGSTNHELIDSLNVEEGNIRYKLSLKNCQAIERGYDLDELAENCADNKFHVGWFQKDDPIADENYGCEIGFKAGFQKALEILGDKKFSEENLLKAFTVGLFSEFEKANYTKEYDDFLKSLQQTEWEVEFNPEEVDKDDCLILKII